MFISIFSFFSTILIFYRGSVYRGGKAKLDTAGCTCSSCALAKLFSQQATGTASSIALSMLSPPKFPIQLLSNISAGTKWINGWAQPQRRISSDRVIRLKRIYNFLCYMLVYTLFVLYFVTLRDIFMHFLELTY
jgi:hypothetical protein